MRLPRAEPGTAADRPQYGRLTAISVDTGETLTSDPITVSVPDQYYRRVVEVQCDGSIGERWTDASGAVVPAPPMEQLITCTASPGNFDLLNNVQTVTLRVTTGPVRVRAAGSGSPTPTAWEDDTNVPTGTVLTWGVANDSHTQLDGSLIFTGAAATGLHRELDRDLAHGQRLTRPGRPPCRTTRDGEPHDHRRSDTRHRPGLH